MIPPSWCFSWRFSSVSGLIRSVSSLKTFSSFASIVSSVVIGLVLGIGFFGIIKLILWVVLIDCVLVGLFVSTIYWFVFLKIALSFGPLPTFIRFALFTFSILYDSRYVSNRYLLANPKSNLDVEWAYCFDVHLNAVLPLLAILHVVQLPFLNSK